MFQWLSLFRRKPKSTFYLMNCPKCGFMKDFELVTPRDAQVEPNSEGSPLPEMVRDLPRFCPECGARLRKQKMFVEVHAPEN